MPAEAIVQRNLIPILSGRRELTQNKRLDDPIDHVGCNIDAKGPKDQSRATVLLRIIGFGDGSRGRMCQVSQRPGSIGYTPGTLPWIAPANLY